MSAVIPDMSYFRNEKVTAPLKGVDLVRVRRPQLDFRNEKVTAPLKAPSRNRFPPSKPYFRNEKVTAPLKVIDSI